jgi:hypothetical protein
VPTLPVEVTQAREAATTTEATRITTMLVAETSALEASAAWDNTTLRVKYAEFQATLVEQEVLERMSRAEVENTTVLASAREDVESLVRKIALLEGELVVEHRAWEVSKRER